ncbi:MAG: hypothetical protein KGM42_04610 [Hyphomicrobiales bacterium]|nr:hypothetical protein [Hyphomicrobiales bacterium]
MNSETTGAGDMLRSHPLGAALVGAGLVWLFAGAKSETMRGAARSIGDVVARNGGRTADRIRDIAGDARAAVREASGGAGDYVSDMADAARKSVNDIASDMGDAANAAIRSDNGRALASGLSAARDNIGRMIEAQPLLVAAGGFALGAAIAASLPVSGVEKRTLGGKLADAATDTVREAKAQAAEVVDAAREAGKEAGLI